MTMSMLKNLPELPAPFYYVYNTSSDLKNKRLIEHLKVEDFSSIVDTEDESFKDMQMIRLCCDHTWAKSDFYEMEVGFLSIFVNRLKRHLN